MNKYFAGVALFLSFSSEAMTQTPPPAQQPMTAAAMFGVRESFIDVSLSPDGTHVAYIQPTAGQGSAVYTVAIGTGEAPKRILVASGDPERLEWCNWASATRLVCSVYFVQRTDLEVYASSRLVAVNAAGGEVKMISRREGENALSHSFYGGDIIDWLPDGNGTVLMQQWYVPEAKAGSLIEKRDEGLGVDQIDTLTLAKKPIVKPWSDAESYITDGHGNVRIVRNFRRDSEGYIGKMRRFQYRAPGQTSWKPLSEYDTLSDEGFYPLAVDATQNVAFGLQKIEGRQAVVKRALDDTGRTEVVYAHPQVDVDGLVRIGKARRVVGVSFATDRRRQVYFDPDLKTLAAKLEKALGGNQQVYIADASIDEQKLLLFVGSDVNPGRYYLFDRKTSKLGELFQVRPALGSVKLAEVRPVQIKASDGAMIPGYLTLPPGSDGKNLPALVIPHGGPGARDEWGFDWLPQYFANQGFAVLQPNFRGSAGYGDNWFQINGYQSWKIAIGDVTDSGRWLVAQGIADPKRLAIMGWSYGGYAALQSGVVAPDLFKAIVAIAPVTDFALLRTRERNTSAKYVQDQIIGSGPHIVEGSPARNVERIQAPVLMFHGTLDRNVQYQHATMMEGKLKDAGKPVELVTFKNLDHYLEDGAVRTQMLSKSSDFLRNAMGMAKP